MMKNLLLYLLCLVALSSEAKTFKVVGYIPSYRWSVIQQINYSNLTHVCVAFVNPDVNGVLGFVKNIDDVVALAHAAGVKVLPSLSGGGSFSWGADTAIYKDLLSDAKRTDFIHTVMNYVRIHQLDGVDLDFEGPGLKLANYDKFACALADSLHAQNLEISGAFGDDNYSKYVADETFAKMDFITTMSYGGVGSWNYNKPTNEATFDVFANDIAYFAARGLSAQQIVGGVPFYAVEFPMSPQVSYNAYSYPICTIISNVAYAAQDPLHHDTIWTLSNHPIYLNSLPTFKKKIEHAAANGGGIMIWELGQDCFTGSVRILDTLTTYIEEALAVKSPAAEDVLHFYPNPAKSHIQLVGNVDHMQGYVIYNIFGQALAAGKDSVVDVSFLSTGVYTIAVTMKNQQRSTLRLLVE